MDILAARKKAAERMREQPGNGPVAAPAAQEIPVSSAPAPETAVVLDMAVPVETAEDAAGAGTLAESGHDTGSAASGDVVEPQIQELEMLSFRLAGEEYAVLVEDVKEVLKNRELTPVPNAPDHILGVTSLRGPILPVVDLCKRLGLPGGLRDEKSRILVLTVNDEDAGIVVDRVTGVVRIQSDSIRPVPETIERGAEYLKGIARREDKLYILLDIEKALGA
jgi:purine-binding chemotaxis protein CheW